MAALSFSETFAISALTAGIALVGTLAGLWVQAQNSQRQAEQAERQAEQAAEQFKQTLHEQRRNTVLEQRNALIGTLVEQQREALDNVQRKALELSARLPPETTTPLNLIGTSDVRSAVSTPEFLKDAAAFRMWVSRIDDDEVREAADKFLLQWVPRDKETPVETQGSLSDANAATRPALEVLLELTGARIRSLPAYHSELAESDVEIDSA